MSATRNICTRWEPHEHPGLSAARSACGIHLPIIILVDLKSPPRKFMQSWKKDALMKYRYIIYNI
jgi:hypothetical protein